MVYIGGISWNATDIDGKTITWIGSWRDLIDKRPVHSVLDPSSTQAARRILRDGTVLPLDAERGLTVYGNYGMDRPTLTQVRDLTPEYAHLVDKMLDRRGTTRHRITADQNVNRLCAGEVAQRIGVSVSTVHRYHSAGTMPRADDYVGRSPVWLVSTIDGWERPGRGAGGGRPRIATSLTS